MDPYSDFIQYFASIFSPLAEFPWSVLTIIVVNLFLAFISIAATNRFTDMEKMKADMEEVKVWREKMNEARKSKNQELLEEVIADQGRIMRINSSMMSARMKPMCVYYIPFLLVFAIMGAMFGNSVVAVLPFNIQNVPGLGFLEGMLGTATNYGFGFSFYGFYLLVGLGLGNLIRKPFGQSMTT